jgi:hypothetical protein
MKSRKFCVTFAGAVGSSKTPIAHYLGCNFNLPILSNDVIRTEVREDLQSFNDEEYERRRDIRLKEMVEAGASFIYDASVDRKWKSLKVELDKFRYECFIISLDLSKDFLAALYKAKNYPEVDGLDRLIKEHKTFLTQYRSEVLLSISDATFKDRLKLSHEALARWLGNKF